MIQSNRGFDALCAMGMAQAAEWDGRGDAIQDIDVGAMTFE